MMRVPTQGEMLSNIVEGGDETPFLVVALEFGVKFPLTPFVRQFLSELPLHLLQVSLALWKNLLALCVMWHKAYGQDPNMAELQACFGLKAPYKISGTYCPYNTGGKTLKK